MKKIILSLGAITSIALPVTAVVSCNVSLAKEQKNNSISNKNLYETPQAKKLLDIISTKFEYSVINDFWTKKINDSTWDDIKKIHVANSEIHFDSDSSINRIMNDTLSAMKSSGQLYRKLRDVEYGLWRNIYFDENVQSLLNNIKTVYNRNKIVYPIKQNLLKVNGNEYASIDFQVDLITPMKRRYMSTYTNLNVMIPNFKATDQTIWDYFKFDSALTDNKTIDYVLDRYFVNTTNTKGVLGKWFTDSKYMNNKIIDWYTLQFKKNSNGKYQIQYTYYDTLSQDTDGKLVKSEKTALFTQEFATNAKLSEVATYLEKQIYTENENDYIKSLFTAANGLEGHVEFASLAGTSINGNTIDDYVTNLQLTSKTNGGSVDLGHVNFYVNGKTSAVSWYQTDIPFKDGGNI